MHIKPNYFFFYPFLKKNVKSVLLMSSFYWLGLFIKNGGLTFGFWEIGIFTLAVIITLIYNYQIYRNRKLYSYKVTDEEIHILLKNRIKTTIKVGDLIGFEVDQLSEEVSNITLFIYLDYDINDPKRVSLLGLSISDADSMISFLKKKGLKKREF